LKDLVLVTPVKDSINTLRETVGSIKASAILVPYFIFDDFKTASDLRTLGISKVLQAKDWRKTAAIASCWDGPSSATRQSRS